MEISAWKKKKNRRMVAMLLALVMILGVFIPLQSVEAADPPVIGVDHPVEPGDVMLFKQVDPVEGMLNVFDVTLRIEAKDLQQTNDIVLVIDKSGSMQGERMANAKAAAIQFVNQLLTEEHPKTRIALISFATEVSTHGGFLNYQNKDSLINAINGIYAYGGTFTQGGVEAAKGLLRDSTADIKQMVLLSDGEPTKGYAVTDENALNPDYLRRQYITVAESVWSNSLHEVYGNRLATTSTIPETMFDYNSTVGQGRAQFYRYDNPWGTTNDKYYNHGNSAIAEAGFVKANVANTGGGADMATVHTIALDAGTSGTQILTDMASPDKAYSTTDPAELSGIFATIAADIQAAMTDAQVSDPMGLGFAIPIGQIEHVDVSQGTYEVTGGGSEISWNLGPTLTNSLPAPNTDIKYAEMTYRIEITDSILDVIPRPTDGQYETNGEAQLTYTDIDGNVQTTIFPTPTTIPLVVEIKKVLLDARGNPIGTDPFGRNYQVNVTVEEDATYNKDYYIDGNDATVMTDIRIDGNHTIKEVEERRNGAPGNLDDYETTIEWTTWDGTQSAAPMSGRSLTDFLIPKDGNGDPMNTTITVTNQEKALGVLRITKKFELTGAPGAAGSPKPFTVNVVGKNAYNPDETVYNENHTVNAGQTIALENLPYGTYTVTEPDTQGFVVSFTDSNGTSLTDGVVEIGLDSKEQSVTVTNTPAEGDTTVDFTATKKWVGGAAADHTAVALTLYQNGTATTGYTPAVTGADPEFTYIWTGLPKYDAGANVITYTARETSLPQYYAATYDDVTNTITNTFDPSLNTKTVTADKVWVNGPAEKPTTYFTLYRQVEGGTEERVTQDAVDATVSPKELLNGTTSVSWENMPYTNNDALTYTYFVKETDETGADATPTNYTKLENGLTVTNTYQSPPTGDGELTFTKAWVHGPTTKPDVQFQLMRRNGTAGAGEEVTGQVETVTSGSNTVTFEPQDANDINGVAYEYYVREVGETNGSIALGGFNYHVDYDDANKTVTNTFVQNFSEVTAEKEWINGPANKPDVGLQLHQKVGTDGTVDAVSTATIFRVHPGGSLTKTWTMPTTDLSGVPITYSVKEVDRQGVDYAPENYTKSEVGMKVTNTYQSPKIDITATKTWVGGNTSRPDVVFKLYRQVGTDGTPELVPDIAPITLPDGATTATWTGIDETDNSGQKYIFSVKEFHSDGTTEIEGPPENYTAFEDSLKVTNYYTSPYDVTYTFTKVWEGDPDVTRPDIILTLWRKTGEGNESAVTDAATKTVNGTTTTAQWTDLLRTDENGNPFIYYVQETLDTEENPQNCNWKLGEYNFTDDTITNSVKTAADGLATLTVTKKPLANPETTAGTMGLFAATPITFPIKVTGPYGYETTFDLAPGASKVLTGLYFGEYTVVETDTKGYTATYSTSDNTTDGKVKLWTLAPTGKVEITNTSGGTGTLTDVTATKTWVNGPTADHTAVDLILKRTSAKEGSVAETVNVDPTISGEASPFTYTWTDLPARDADGYDYTYSVEEAGVVDGKVTVNGNTYAVTQEGNAITNTYEVPQTEANIVATKTWEDYEDAEYTAITKPDIKFELWRKGGTADTGEKVPGVEAQVPDATTGEVDFGKQDKTDLNGVTYTYFVVEVFDNPDDVLNQNWIVTEDELSVTNKLLTKPTDPENPGTDDRKAGLTVTKVLENEVPQTTTTMFAMAAPMEFDFTLTGPYGYRQTFTLKAGESKEFKDLFFGEYQVTETETNGYNPTYSTTDGKVTLTTDSVTGTVTVTNKRAGGEDDPNAVSKTVTKVWVNGPKSDTIVELWRKGVEVDGTTAIDEKVDEFTANATTTSNTFTALDKHDPSGREYEYYVKEPTVPANYTASAEGLTVTNTYEVPQTEAELVGEKVWDMTHWVDDYQEDIGKADIRLELWRKGGTAGDGERAVAGQAPGADGKVNFGRQAKTDINGVEYTYYVKEVFADPDDPWNDNWVVTEDEMTVTNRIVYNQADDPQGPEHPDERVGKLTIAKKVVGGGAQETFDFVVKGPKGYEKTVTVSANGSLELEGLYYGTYTVQEVPVNKYTATYEPAGGQVTLRKNSPEATVTVTNKYKAGGSPATPKPTEPKKISAVICRADLFPDSLTSSVLARAVDAPILLTSSKKLDSRVAAELKRLGVNHAYIIGGEIAITPSTMDEVKAITGDAERIGGANRYETSALLARKVTQILGMKHTAAIASGERFPDALTISPFAIREGYPILLVKKDSVPESIFKAIEELEIEKTYIAGGIKAVSEATAKLLPDVVERLGGPDRYGTATAIAGAKFPNAFMAFVASGEEFADALVIGPIAAKNNAPVLLVGKTKVPPTVKTHLAEFDIKSLIMVGGPSAITDEVEEELNCVKERVYGYDRIETAIRVSQRYFPKQ